MRKYTWSYGIFHWFVHYFLAVMLVSLSGIVIFPIYMPYTLFGIYMKNNIVDHFLVIIVSSLIDLDHLPVLRRFGTKRVIFAEKRVVTPLHNFFFLSLLSILSAFTAIFVSKAASVLIFSVALHMIWDIVEDVIVFRTSFRRWEKTWGLDIKEIEAAYNELLQSELLKQTELYPKKESKIRRIGTRLRDRIRRKKV